MRIRLPHARQVTCSGLSVTCSVASGRLCFLAIEFLLLPLLDACSCPPVSHLQIKFATLVFFLLKVYADKLLSSQQGDLPNFWALAGKSARQIVAYCTREKCIEEYLCPNLRYFCAPVMLPL